MTIERFLGPLAADAAVSEIMINGPGPVWVERHGRVEVTGLEVDGHGLDVLIESVMAPLGLRVDRSHPIADARLPDGSRVNVVVPPLAVGGPAVSIRRFARSVLPLEAFGPPEMAERLTDLVVGRSNILVAGPTSSGKTSLLAALLCRVDVAERVVCLEDVAELPIDRPNTVRLESRPANSEGVGGVSLRRLVLTSLRMRPDRLVVGEVRGAEAFDLLLALTSGHRGCLTSCHADSAADALDRLETLAGLDGLGPGPERLRRLVLAGVDAVVVTSRTEGRRGVESISVVEGSELRPRWQRCG
jgi:pilus assembly protein CpaF